MSPALDSRLQRLKAELNDHARIARHLGLDFERPIRSLGDGYPEYSVSLVGKFTERILKQLWRHHNVPGDPAGKSLSELIKGCAPFVRSTTVLDALRDIQRLRNRSAHDGYVVADEDGLTAVRRLLEVLGWFSDTGSDVLTGQAPRLTPVVAAKAQFLSGLYLTLGFSSVKRFELSECTVYQLFARQSGLRTEYVELILSRDIDEVRQVLASTGGQLLDTRLPKTTRFLVVDENGSTAPDFADYRIVAYDRFLETILNVEAHLAAVEAAYPTSHDLPERIPLAADLLATDPQSGDMQVTEAGDAAALLEQLACSGGNALVVGRSGSGKSALLKQLVAQGATATARRYRFYFDLSLKRRDENFADYVARTLGPVMGVDRARVVDGFRYFARSGSVVCALDAIDEAVAEHTQAGFLALFTELAEILSAESVVVMSSRTSFLADSPQVRRLLDGAALMSEKLVAQLHAEGVDPRRLPRFSVIRLHDIAAGDGAEQAVSPLELRLSTTLDTRGPFAELLALQLRRVAEATDDPDMLARMVEFFGGAALRGQCGFSLTELWNALGAAAFRGGQLSVAALRLRPVLRQADENRVAFVHSAYQEHLAAQYLRATAARDSAMRVTEQIRAFLAHGGVESAADRILRPGLYLVGPSHQLMLRHIAAPVVFDKHAVTVARYNEFLSAIGEHGSAQWDHPDKPPDAVHDPTQAEYRLRIPDYYDNPAYAQHPAVCVSWWSAYAFARFAGARLPTSLEWEAAARGPDGRLFPWGDDVDLAAVNCADAWSGRPLITYASWLAEVKSGGLAAALPEPVDAHPRNVSPIGVHQMVGNVWEYTETAIEATDEVVICGGAFDNPYRAVQTHSKGLIRPGSASNAVGFRTVVDL
ncbi:SUMF1/EgtB/PvdO family nonheme iron enzyme [Nocardia altamirensis]|uniref:SUMF1/EgtB/PvdO family nonheme iron enzyme n=1 Tax=Nocardia altamirensis TaxID=472158 RepID=UPI00083FF989|nr:SUMF1/EgtB/PvdO family nonheme iron enzyme [Nocardia altamirensis]